ncbi:MAG: 7-carboxy-7-deazaguanine synthase QueE, partial [Alphaproteobacteria bacterium]|nr:7-carboxy-7-deazaguanine synthase QueE [Alphaproteobacteria bacterium]
MIKISEIFGPTVQGEGPLIGKPTVFVRTGGCDYRCTWCDTLYAVLPEHGKDWRAMEPGEILAEVSELSDGQPILITLSGGNPAMQKLGPLIDLGHARGFTFALETQGSISRDWFARLDWLFLSPKPPSSGETVDWDKFDDCVAAAGGVKTALKVAIFDEADYEFARAAAARHPALPVYLQVGNPAYPEPADADAAPLAGAALQSRLME